MKLKLIAIAALMVLCSTVQAGEQSLEMADKANDKINSDLLTPICQEFLDQHYSGLHVAHVGYLINMIIDWELYQHSVITISNDNCHWGLCMEYIYDPKLHGHTFIRSDQLAKFARTADRQVLYDHDYKHLFDGQSSDGHIAFK